jgi:hypothetical protein
MQKFFLELSKNEQVSVCVKAGAIEAHHGMSGEELLTLLDSGEVSIPDPINKYRIELMEFIKENKAQLVLSCHGDCRLHSFAKVLQCHHNTFGENE